MWRRLCLSAVLALSLTATTAVFALQANAAFPGANGRIAFQTNRSGNFEIYSMKPDGSDPVDLTNNAAFDSAPSWSADGTKIAFVRDSELYVMNADGSDQTVVSSPGCYGPPAWSPDSSKIAITGCDDDIYVVNVDGTGSTDLTNTEEADRFPSWSRDGTRIAFSRINPSTSNDDIWVMDADGSNPIDLTNNPSIEELHPDWSPDGSKIAYYRDGDIFVMNADGSAPTDLTNTPSVEEAFPAWAPDGTRIAMQVCGAHCDIWTMAADGAERVNLTGGSNADNYVPDWQPLPTITSFAPTSGPVGTSVTITGTNFTGATSVAFNTTPTTTFTVNSSTTITATVPTGATTGPIEVTTPAGTATSAANFVVGSLVSIAVTPRNPRVLLGADIQFTATGTYSDGSTSDLTAAVTWSSSQTTVATISSQGLAHGVAKGRTIITAASGAISGSTPLRVKKR